MIDNLTVSKVIHWAIPILIVIILAVFTVLHLKELLTCCVTFVRLAFNERRTAILGLIQKLMSLPTDHVRDAIDASTLRILTLQANLPSLAQKYTKVYTLPKQFGIYDKVETRYYVDFVKACIISHSDRRLLAGILGNCIVENLGVDNLKGTLVVGQAAGNVLLAEAVAETLELPFILVGSLAGRTEQVFGDELLGHRAIVVDDIASSGGMMVRTLELLRQHNMPCSRVFVLIKRSNECVERVAKYCTEKSLEITIVPVHTLLDADFRELSGRKGSAIEG